MSLDLSPSDLAFRDEVRRFLDETLTDELRLAGRLCAGMYCDRPIAQQWLATLNRRGWAVPKWPVAYGGCDWSPVRHYVFASELVAAEAPPITPNATGMLGPVLIAYGTDEQKARYVPRIPTGEDWWAQGYSEPGSGSDLASLQCRAVRDGDHYVINGSKIWTSHAQWSNRIFCLVRTRTEGKAQAGISFLVFDMDLPGITVSPIITLAGDHEVNQVFFDNVRVPASGLVGEENQGWSIAKYLLTHERSGSYAPRLRQRLGRIRRFCERSVVAEDRAMLTRRLVDLELQVDVLEAAEHRTLSLLSHGKPSDGTSSMLKTQGTELLQRIDEAFVEVSGFYAAADQTPARHGLDLNLTIGPPEAVTATAFYLNDRAASIYAGSNEIQRNIMAGLLLR